MALEEICGLWLGETKSGKKKMSGKVGRDIDLKDGDWLMVLKNESPKGNNPPGYRLLLQVPDDTGPVETAPADDGDVPF